MDAHQVRGYLGELDPYDIHSMREVATKTVERASQYPYRAALKSFKNSWK